MKARAIPFPPRQEAPGFLPLFGSGGCAPWRGHRNVHSAGFLLFFAAISHCMTVCGVPSWPSQGQRDPAGGHAAGSSRGIVSGSNQ